MWSKALHRSLHRDEVFRSTASGEKYSLYQRHYVVGNELQ